MGVGVGLGGEGGIHCLGRLLHTKIKMSGSKFVPIIFIQSIILSTCPATCLSVCLSVSLSPSPPIPPSLSQFMSFLSLVHSFLSVFLVVTPPPPRGLPRILITSPKPLFGGHCRQIGRDFYGRGVEI